MQCFIPSSVILKALNFKTICLYSKQNCFFYKTIGRPIFYLSLGKTVVYTFDIILNQI